MSFQDVAILVADCEQFHRFLEPTSHLCFRTLNGEEPTFNRITEKQISKKDLLEPVQGGFVAQNYLFHAIKIGKRLGPHNLSIKIEESVYNYLAHLICKWLYSAFKQDQGFGCPGNQERQRIH